MQASKDEDREIRTFVTVFGSNFKKVSIVSPVASGEIANAYAPFVTPSLLAQWERDPLTAPGRKSSSIWPDSIQISSVSKSGDNYRVEGSIVLLTTEDEKIGKTSALLPVHILVSRDNDRWVITTYQSP